MTYNDFNAVYALNSYVWKLLEANLGWTRDDYQGRTPIIPTAQQPELMQSGKAFLVYGSAIHQPTHLYALRNEAVSYTIYAPSSTDANKIANLLNAAFERQDEAADDVNHWLGVENKSRGVSFGTIRAVMVEKAEPADEEGGYVAALVMLDTKYTSDESNIITTFTS